MSNTDKPDTAWLIGLRDSALALGVENGEWRWTCPDLALRFKRREDALAAVSLLDPAWRLQHPLEVQEHEWCDGQPEPEAKPEKGRTTSVYDAIKAERERQKSAEGWTVEHDDKYIVGELGSAARSYQLAALWIMQRESNGQFANPLAHIATSLPAAWPWSNAWWKPVKDGLTREENARRCMVKAGALLIAEAEQIERSFRAKGGA